MQEFYVKPRNTGSTKYFTHYFSKDLYFNLKNHIKGAVYCKIEADTLKVTIYGVNGIVWRYTQDNIQSEIVQGLSIQMVTQIIVKRYKSYINYLYFN